ncbi:MAG: hypothetical protein WCG01_00830 [bacterium]
MSLKVVKKTTSAKGSAVAKPKAKPKKIVKQAPAEVKKPVISSSRKVIEIKKIHGNLTSGSMLDLRQQVSVDNSEEVDVLDEVAPKKVLIESALEKDNRTSKVSSTIERLKASQKDESSAVESKVRQYDLDEKIDFKNLHGRSFNIYRKISVSFVILTGFLLAAIFYFSLVKVDIAVVMSKGELKGSSVLTVSGSQVASSTTSVIGVVKEVEIYQTEEIPTTGVESLGQDVTGTVKLVNNYVRNQPLVASTRLLSTNNQLLRIKNTVNVPAGGSVEVQVYADKADSAINVPLGTRLNIPGLWAGIQDKIYAEAIEDIKYKETIKHTVTQADLDGAIEVVKKAVTIKAENEIVPTYNTQYSKVLFKIDDASIVTSAVAKVGEEMDKFKVTATIKVAVIAFNEADAKKIAEMQLNSAVPENKLLLGFNDKEVTYELGTYDVYNNSATVNIGYSGTVVAKNPSVIDKSKLVGLSADQLKNYLSSLPDVASFKVTFIPGFIGKVPSYTDRIKITPVEQIQ